MQTHGGSTANEIILSNQRNFRARVLVDWNRNGKFDHPLSDLSGYVESVSFEKSLAGSAPSEILLVEGSAAAELSFTFSGMYKGMSFPSVFSRYNQASPFYGKVMVTSEVKFWLEVETPTHVVEYKQFRGVIRTITPDRAENRVEITCLDFVENLRKPVFLPHWAMSEEHVNYGEGPSQWAQSHWVIDSCLRLCDVGASGKRPKFKTEQGLNPDGAEGVQFFMTGNGSYLPTIGWVDNLNASTFPAAAIPMFERSAPVHPLAPTGTPRPWGLNGLGTPVQQRYGTPSDQGILRYWVADRDGINPRSAHYMGFTLNTNGPNAARVRSVSQYYVMEVAIGNFLYLYIEISAGKVRTRLRNDSSKTDHVSPWYDIPTDRDNVDICGFWDLSGTTGSNTQLRIGNTLTSKTILMSGSPVSTGYNQIGGRVTVGQAVSLSDVFYSSRNYYGASLNTGEAYTMPKYAAVLDQGLNRYSYMPSSSTAKEAWGIITQVAAAEFGSVFWDEDGTFRFWNYSRMIQKQNTIVRHYTLDHVSGLNMTDSTDSIRNIYTVTTSKRRSLTGISTVYQSNDVEEFYVPGRTTKFFKLFVDDIVSPLTFTMVKHDSMPDGAVGSPEWTDAVRAGYCVQYQFPIGWYEDPTRQGVDINVYFNTQGHLTVRIWNGWNEPIRLAKGGTAKDGSSDNSAAAFRIGGSKIVDNAPISILTRNKASIDKYGSRTLNMSGDWIQDSFGAADMFAIMMPRTGEPIPATDSITVAGDPRIQLGDTIAITDKEGLGTGIRLQIYGIRRGWSRNGGLTDTYTVEVLQPDVAPVTPPPPDIPDFPIDLPTEPFDSSGQFIFNLVSNPAAGSDMSDIYGPAQLVRSEGLVGMPRETGLDLPVRGTVSFPKARITSGKYYTLSVHAKARTESTSGWVIAHWYTDTGFLSSSLAVGWVLPLGTVSRFDTGMVQAPENATMVLLSVISNHGVHLTGAQYQRGALTNYFDGDSEKSNWTGTEHLSISRRDMTGEEVIDPGTPPDPDPQPANPSDSAAYQNEWGIAIPASDTFTYSAPIKSNKWVVEGTAGSQGGDECWIGASEGRRCVSNVSLTGSALQLTGDVDGDSGAVSSVANMLRGRWEVRARFSGTGAGVKYQPVIELMPASEVVPDDGRYQFMIAKVDDTSVKAVIHYPRSDDTVQQFTKVIDPTVYHNYAIEWNSSEIIGYVDGVQWFVMTDDTGLTDVPMHLRLALDNPTGGVMQPATMDIEWARMYPLVHDGPGGGYGTGGYGTSPYGV